MQFVLEAQIQLLTLNKAFLMLKSGGRIRSPEYVRFSLAIFKLMRPRYKELEVFNEAFDYFKHELHAELTYYTPNIYTKDGKLSKIGGDVANMEKCLTDCVLIGKINDSCITKWTMTKHHADKHAFKLVLTIKERS